MARYDFTFCHAAHTRRFDKLFMLQTQGLAAHDTRHVQPRHQTHGGKNQKQVAAEECGQQNHEKHKRKRVQNFQKTHHQRIELTADKAGNRAVKRTDDNGYQCTGHTDQQGNTSAGCRTRQQIAAEQIRTQIVMGRKGRRNLHIVPVGEVVGVADNPWRHNHKNTDQQQDDNAVHRRFVLFKTPPCVAPQAFAVYLGVFCCLCKGLSLLLFE